MVLGSQLPDGAPLDDPGAGGLPIPDALTVSRVQELFDEKDQPKDGTWSLNLRHFIDELLFYAKALAEARNLCATREKNKSCLERR